LEATFLVLCLIRSIFFVVIVIYSLEPCANCAVGASLESSLAFFIAIPLPQRSQEPASRALDPLGIVVAVRSMLPA
jgi:hypothetical protein